jgi:hypothetical protein
LGFNRLRPGENIMNLKSLIQRNVALTATIIVATFVFAFAVFHFPSVETAAYAFGSMLIVCASVASIIHWHRNNRLNEERRLAMQSVEDLCTSVDLIEKDLPFTRYQRLQFSRATGQALKLSDSLRDWITLVHLRLDRQSITHKGLQLKGVPAFVDNIMDQVREAYKFVRAGGEGIGPRILDPSWFDETEICGEEVLLFPTSRQCRTPTLGAAGHKRISMEYPKLRSSATPSETTARNADVTTSKSESAATISVPAVYENPGLTTCSDHSSGILPAPVVEQIPQPVATTRTLHGLDPELLRQSGVLIFDQSKRRQRA